MVRYTIDGTVYELTESGEIHLQNMEQPIMDDDEDHEVVQIDKSETSLEEIRQTYGSGVANVLESEFDEE